MVEGEIDNLTMKQYLALTRGNHALGMVKPEIGGNVNFEIKSQFMRELREDTFSKNKNDDAHEHVEQVLDIVSLFNIPDVSYDVVMLRIFPITLTGAAKIWVDRLPPGTVDSCDLLIKAFIQRKSTTSSKKETRNYTKLRNGIFDNEEQETDNSGMVEVVAALEATLKKKRQEHKKDIRIPVILGRPLLATAHAQVDIFRKTISLEVGSEKVIFKMRSSFTTTNFESVHSIKSETFVEDDNLKEIDYDLFLYDSESYEDDLERILDYLKPRSYDVFIDLDDEAYNKRRCRLLGMTYEEPTPVLIEKAKVTRYIVGPGETCTKVNVLGVEKIPRTRDNVVAMRARLMKK
uniref:Reverse transcriptase domain-containing protein n=1 Tax=Tanacetum cinerariifolium TaxID=118510 RepID=A0A6L2K4Q7_TANCI|nr:hypothetical protein [Tanacetum cinerariifolium]